MTTKFSATQQALLDDLKTGLVISHFRGIGTRYSSSASLEDNKGNRVRTISISTFKALRNKSLLEKTSGDAFHSTYILKATI